MKMNYKLLFAGSVLAIGVMALLAGSVNEREAERISLATSPAVPDASQNKSEEWARYYPRQYGSWKKTKESSLLTDMLKEKSQLAVLWSGYGFAKDYNAPRGHYYAVQDNVNSLRTGAPVDAKTGPMPTACWTCKSPDVPRIMERDGELEYFTGKWAKYGDEIVNSIGCADCHSNKTGELVVRRPYLDRALESAGLPKFADSTHQEKRSLVCAQCHTEYYFKKTEWTDKEGTAKVAKVVTLPWQNGLTAEGAEQYYDDMGFKDWTHKISKTPMLKTQHPGYELFKTGIHGQKGVSCADCHMPYTQEGSVKYSDHQLQNPLETMERSCMPCHRESETKLRGIVLQKYKRKEQLHELAMDNLAKAHLETAKAMEAGATDAELKDVRADIRSGQWKWDYAVASHPAFFHAPEETLRLLAVANESAMQARIALVGILAKHGVVDFIAPDFSNKTNAQGLAGVPLEKLVAAKKEFKATLEKEWYKQAVTKGNLNLDSRKGLDEAQTSY
ncbi:ammonia-forming cytochrome c nitrite reductase [Sulfurovum sp.]|uniref:ammonia-forming cytochrome c nitrite reductase n=1 Tax=Sulfurovum sp. TaxID=1969726 RepID=UPI0028683A65|nr:ammonia-forming cytochrome c nitrite reductase [Sulfurovum sp.]